MDANRAPFSLALLLKLFVLSGNLLLASSSPCRRIESGGACLADGESGGGDGNALLQRRSGGEGTAGKEALAPERVARDEPNPPEWPPSVHVFSEATPESEMEAAIAAAWATNGRQPSVGDPFGQFSTARYAFLFKQGTYSVDVPVGYYTQVLGLGTSPDSVVFDGDKGPHVPCEYSPSSPGQLDTFWRSAENFRRIGSTTWAVSQAAPIRRVHISQDLVFAENGCWASGGYLGNSVVGGMVSGGGQQQWFTRSTNVSWWAGIGWNAAFVGVDVGRQQCDLRQNRCGTSPFGPKQTVVIEKVPLVAEKPFISVDPSNDTKFVLNVPQVRRASIGADWSTGTSYPFQEVYVTKPTDTAADINAKLRSGLHVVVTPAIYALDEPLQIVHTNQVLLCLGFATLQSAGGNAAVEVGADVDGARIAGCLLEAGTVKTPALLQWGDGSNEGTGENPGLMFDLFARVGGPTNNATADAMVRVESGNVIGDNLWLWRADHYDSGSSTIPIRDGLTVLGELPCDHGLVVTGDNVTMYGLFAEHALKDQVLWSGENGATYFFQCEAPYDVTPAWAEAGYVAYRVDEGVAAHWLYAPGVYSFFRDYEVWMHTAISTPPGVQASVAQPFVVFLNGNGGISSTINGEGPGVGGLGSFEMQFLNNDCSAKC